MRDLDTLFSDFDEQTSWIVSSVSGGTPGVRDEGAAPNTFDLWQANIFSRIELEAPLISGSAADLDKDGFNNLSEYAFGLDPRSVDLPEIQVEMELVDDDLCLSVTYRRAKTAIDLTYLVEVSDNLLHWTLFSFGTQDIEDAGPGTERVTMTDGQPIDVIPHRFVRIRVVAP